MEIEMNREMPGDWRILESHNHPLHTQLIVGFPNGYALSMITGHTTYGDRERGTVEIGFMAWNTKTDGLDNNNRRVVSYDHATKVLHQDDSVIGDVTLSECETLALFLASLPNPDFIEVCTEDYKLGLDSPE